MAAVKLHNVSEAIKKSARIFLGGLLLFFFFITTSVFAQDNFSADDIMTKLKTDLDLQDDQITNITPIVEKYSLAMQDLQKSIDDGTINPSAIDSQKQGLENSETQELSAYLKPDQLSKWRDIQSQMYQQKADDNSNADADADSSKYSNLPNNAPSP